MDQFLAIVLASDTDTQMKSKKPNFSHKILGKSVMDCVCSSVNEVGIEKCIFITDCPVNQLEEYTNWKTKYEILDGEATVENLISKWKHRDVQGSNFVVFWGDMPLITPKTILDVMQHHKVSGNSATVLSKALSESDDSSEIYCFVVKDFVEAVSKVRGNEGLHQNFFKEIIGCLIEMGLKVNTLFAGEPKELMRVRDRVLLSEATKILRNRIVYDLMKAGVTIIDPETAFIDFGVKIGIDTIIYPGTIIEGKTVIGENCIIGPNSRIVSSEIGDSVEINNSIVLQSVVGEETRIGPFAYLRPESEIGNRVKIGDFVEIKKSKIGNKTSVAHLSYIGDAVIGNNVNVGCGVVVVNYDGKEKHKTIVEDNAFVGCNVNLVSPVIVHSNAYIAAGSTITEEVSENALAIARSRQVIKEGWVGKRKREK